MRSLLCLFLAVVPFVNGYIPRFLNGRPRGGFLGNPGGPRLFTNLKAVSEEWFVQRLNHFDSSDTRSWKQKYFVNKEFYKEGGPIFVQIGGEGKANPIWMTNGAWVDYAKKYNAYCVMVEHRYYGDSHPTPDMSTQNLKYLSSEQALADLANIVSYLKDEMNGAKVIVFGGSYSGALSAWFRMKYPHLAHGSIASSAPVLARLDFKEYLEVVNDALNTYGDSDKCTDNIRYATTIISNTVKSKGQSELKKMFNLCTDIDISNPKDVENFFSTIANNFLGVVQYNKDNRAFEGAKDTGITIDTLCNMMTNQSQGSIVKNYVDINSMMLKVHGEKCLEFNYNSMIKDMKNVSWDSSAAEGVNWVFSNTKEDLIVADCPDFAIWRKMKTKIETVYMCGSEPYRSQDYGTEKAVASGCIKRAQSLLSSSPQILNPSLLDHIFHCKIYGPEFTEAVISAGVKRTNTNYGGRGLKLTRVLFPNGSIDPWHALSILKDLSPEARAIYIKGTAHCANMYPASPHDLPELTAARTEISNTIGQWLKEQ